MQSPRPAPETIEGGEVRDEQAVPVADQASQKTLSPDKTERVDLHVSSDKIPRLLIEYLEQIAKPKPSSLARTFIRDYLPVITPLAAVVVSVAVSYATILFNQRASITASSETLGKLISRFGNAPAPDGDNQPVNTTQQQPVQEPTAVAMEIALYGDQAMPAVTLALSATDPGIRHGGALVAVQMYRGQTVEHAKLTKRMLTYYDSPALRRGVLEWLDGMGTGLFDEDSKLALEKLNSSFGPAGEECGTQEPDAAVDAAKFLMIYQRDGANDLALGLLQNCPATEGYEAAREQAAIALSAIAERLPKDMRDSIVKSLQSIEPAAPAELAQILDNSVVEIQKIH